MCMHCVSECGVCECGICEQKHGAPQATRALTRVCGHLFSACGLCGDCCVLGFALERFGLLSLEPRLSTSPKVLGERDKSDEI